MTRALIDLDFHARLSEPAGARWRGAAAAPARSFELAVRFSSDAPAKLPLVATAIREDAVYRGPTAPRSVAAASPR